MRTVNWCAVLLSAGLWSAGLAAADGDWPQWRGPNRDGLSTETGLLKSWPAGGPKLVWTAKGLGEGYSSVSVVNGRLYTMGDLNQKGSMLCLNAADGKILWTAEVGRPGGNYPGTRCTPAVSDGLVVGLGQWGDIVCVKAEDGKEVWRRNMEKDFGGKMMSGWGYSESPLIDNGRVVLTPGGRQGAVVALDLKTGATVWQCKEFTDSAAYASLVPVEIGGVKQYLQLTGESVVGIAAADGKLLWKAPRIGKTAVIPTPVYHDNCVFVTSGYGIGCNAFKVTGANGKFNVVPAYDNKEMKNHHGGVIRVGDHVYGHSDANGWRCLELKTGNVVWTDKGVGKGSVAYADGMLYCRGEAGSGTIALVEATPTGYREKGRFDQPNRSNKNSWPHPVIAGGKLYIRDQDVLLCYDVKNK